MSTTQDASLVEMALATDAAGFAETSDSHMTIRARGAFLASKRDELLTPVQAIFHSAERILGISKAHRPEKFVADMTKVRQAAVDMRELIEEVLISSRLEADAAESFDALCRRFRHEMRNRLNPVINYPEFWLEDASEEFLEGFVDELRSLIALGRKCDSLVDPTIASWDVSCLSEADKVRMAAMREIVRHIVEGQSASKYETGHVLVVDDNSVNRDILRRHLEPIGHQVTAVADGREALEIVKRGGIDLVLLDIVMPEMDGFTVLMRLKSDPAMRDVPVIMISALGEVDYVVSCIKMGAEDYLSRPYNPIFLKARINACLEKKRLRERERKYLAEIDRQRRRSDKLLLGILPRKVVDELKGVDKRFAPRRFNGVAVLFADIVKFTPYCEDHTAEEVVENLQRLVKAWERATRPHRIQKIKTIGDAFMAACGLLKPVENPVLNCLRFAEDMFAATRQLGTGWDLRIGIHCGTVMAGVLGSRQYLFDLFGDTVNTAARMESHGIEGRIVLSGDARTAVEHLCHLTELEQIEVKGKKRKVARHRFDAFRSPADLAAATSDALA